MYTIGGTTVRPALVTDLPALATLGKAAVANGARTRLGFNPTDFMVFAGSMMGTPASEVFVAERGGRVHGGIGVFIVPLYFNHAHVILQEVFLWTDHPGVGDALVRGVETWGRARGATEIMFTLSTESGRFRRAEKYLAKRGYTNVEATYARAL